MNDEEPFTEAENAWLARWKAGTAKALHKPPSRVSRRDREQWVREMERDWRRLQEEHRQGKRRRAGGGRPKKVERRLSLAQIEFPVLIESEDEWRAWQERQERGVERELHQDSDRLREERAAHEEARRVDRALKRGSTDDPRIEEAAAGVVGLDTGIAQLVHARGWSNDPDAGVDPTAEEADHLPWLGGGEHLYLWLRGGQRAVTDADGRFLGFENRSKHEERPPVIGCRKQDDTRTPQVLFIEYRAAPNVYRWHSQRGEARRQLGSPRWLSLQACWPMPKPVEDTVEVNASRPEHYGPSWNTGTGRRGMSVQQSRWAISPVNTDTMTSRGVGEAMSDRRQKWAPQPFASDAEAVPLDKTRSWANGKAEFALKPLPKHGPTWEALKPIHANVPDGANAPKGVELSARLLGYVIVEGYISLLNDVGLLGFGAWDARPARHWYWLAQHACRDCLPQRERKHTRKPSQPLGLSIGRDSNRRRAAEVADQHGPRIERARAAGRTFEAIAQELADEGERGRDGGTLTGTSVRRMLIRYRARKARE